MKIGVDLDGVVFDFLEAFIPFVKAWCGEYYTRDQITDRHWRLGPDPDGLSRTVHEALRDFEPHGYKGLNPISGARPALINLRMRGHQIHYITARGQSAFDVTAEKLQELGVLFENPESILHFPGESKVSKMLDIGATVLIDDTPAMVEAAAETFGVAILFDAPYNQEVQDDRIIRVNTWAGVMFALRELETRRFDIPGQLGFRFVDKKTS